MPAKNKRKKEIKTQEIKKRSKIQKGRKNRKKKKSIRLKNQDPTRQDTQAHGKVPQLKIPLSQLLLRLKVPLYVKRKVLQLSIEEASVLV
jgi:hypothetical protein